MATIKEVAEKAQVSVATISRVINEDPKVKATTAIRVKAIIKEMGYSPNLLGRNLRRQKTKNILVLIPTMESQFYSVVIGGIEDCLQKENLNAFISVTHSNPKIEKRYFGMLRNKTFDGAIIFSTAIEKTKLYSLLEGLNVIQCCEREKGTKLPFVGIDNNQGAFDATKYLIDKGHKNIAMISSPNKILSTAYREDGYNSAMKSAGLTPLIIDIHQDYGIFESGIDSYKTIKTKYPQVTAVFAISDMIAAGVAKAMTVDSKPKNLAIFGFDDTFITKLTTPTLSTVKQPRYEIGKKAAENLISLIHDKPCKKEILLPHTLTIRESTAKSIKPKRQDSNFRG